MNTRIGCFETNSSSTHSMVICTSEEYDAWYKDQLFYDSDEECFTTDKEKGETLDEWIGNWGLEYDVNYYTPKNGEEIAIICKYGYDG